MVFTNGAPLESQMEEMSDPADWRHYQTLAHRMVDELAADMDALRQGPVWRPMPDAVRHYFLSDALPAPAALDAVYQDYLRLIAPYASGNRHAGFMGWAQGAGLPAGVLAELLMAGLNMNCGGRDHVGIALERQIAIWVRGWFGFPETSEGLFTTGASQANFIACLAARRVALGEAVRRRGIGGAKLCAYASSGAHGCLDRAMDMAGLGADALRRIPTDGAHRIDLGALAQQIAADRRSGLKPFMLIGTAGSVDVGAFDDLNALAEIAHQEGLWFHVDGAFGAQCIHSERERHRLAGLDQADSLAFDFHKWGQVPYDAGFLLVRQKSQLLQTFSSEAAYLTREPDGLAAGDVWPTDLGPDLSRACRALKTWMVLRHTGREAIAANVDLGVGLARHLVRRIEQTPELELLAYGGLNIVCFRYRTAQPDRLNRAIVRQLHLQGEVAPSTTKIRGEIAIRAAFFNPRSNESDIENLVLGVRRLGAELEGTTP